MGFVIAFLLLAVGAFLGTVCVALVSAEDVNRADAEKTRRTWRNFQLPEGAWNDPPNIDSIKHAKDVMMIERTLADPEHDDLQNWWRVCDIVVQALEKMEHDR